MPSAATLPSRRPRGTPTGDATAPLARDEAGIAVRAVVRIFDFWGLTGVECAALADVGERTWARMRQPGWAGALSQDQTLRLSAIVGLYKALHLYFDGPLADQWVTRPNTGPLFGGARPVDRMREGGLPAIIEVRNMVDALRGGL